MSKEAIDHLNGGWLPIETAPKDNNADILVYSTVTKEFSIACLGAGNNWFGMCDGVAMTEGEGEFWDYVIVNPTHWMPLPPAPEAE